MHGGMSTGPKTLEGIERIRRAMTKHGRCRAAAKAERRQLRMFMKEAREMLSEVTAGLGKP
jgi:hypothetical protein